MAPAFVPNVDRPKLMRALALPLPVALPAADGFDALARAWHPAADGKDLLFWSPGLEHDVGVARAVCARWPGATLFDVADACGLAHLHAVRLTARDWAPGGPPGRWRTSTCR